MKTFLILAVVAVVLFAPVVGADRGVAGGLFDANSGERILETAVKVGIAGVVIGGGVAILDELFGGGDRNRDYVVVRDSGGWGHGHGGWGRDRGCRSCAYEYQRQYNAGLAAGESARRYERFQRDEQSRRREAIRAERAGNLGRQDGFEDGSRPRHRGRW